MMKNILEIAEEIFGPMRSVTREEQEAMDEAIKKISKPVKEGANFFDIYDDNSKKE